MRACESLYNKINDIIKHRDRVLRYFQGLSDRLDSITSSGDIVKSAQLTYLTTVLYQFCEFWAATEAIRKDLRLIEFSSAEQTTEFYLRLRQTLAVFPSGRLHRHLKVEESMLLKYEGRILSGATTIISECILQDDRDGLQFMPLCTFCSQIASDQEFQACLSPLVQFLEDLVEYTQYDEQNTAVDFRWAKLILFSSYLRKLILVLDDTNSIALLPELEEYERVLVESNPKLAENIAFFEEAYPPLK